MKKVGDIYKISTAHYSEARWSGWPESPGSDLFRWFLNFQEAIGGLRGKCYTSVDKVLRGSEADRRLDIFVAPVDAAFQNGEHDWTNILVISESKQNPDEDRSAKTLV